MAIVIRFIAETKKYIEGVGKAIDKTEVFSKKSVDEFRKVTNAVGQWAAATAAAMGAAGLAISKQSGEAAKQLRTLAQVANESVEDFQRYAYAVQTVGVEQDKLSDILKDVNDKIGDFNQASSGGMVDFFEKIAPKVGITRKHFEGLSGKNALQLYVSSLEKANVSQADMTFYMEAIASDATALLPLLRNNGAELNRLAGEADQLGIVLDGVDVERLAQMDNAFARIAAKAEMAKKQIALGLAPVIGLVADRILESSDEMDGFEGLTINAMSKVARAVGVFLDALHMVKIVLGGIAVLVKGFVTSVSSLFTELAIGIADDFDEIINMLNLVIKNVNKVNPFGEIPLIDTVSNSGFMKGLRQSQKESEMIFEMMKKDWHDLVMSKLPSEEIKEVFAEAYERAKVERAKLQEGMLPNVPGGAGGEGAGGENELERKRRQERLQLIRESLKEEEDLLRFDFDQKREQLLLALEQGIIDQDDYRMLSLAAEQKYMEDLYNIRKNGYDGMNDLIKEHYGFAASETVGAFRSILETASTGSKKLFKVNQALALSDALISTYQGIAAGVKLGWPQGIPAVAWAAANGFAQVSKIRSMSYGGGGSGGSSAGASDTGASAAQAAPPPNTFNVAISGMNPNQIFSGSQFGDIIGVINDRLRAGDRLVGISA